MYDACPLRELTGKALRPGGAALTLHGLGLCAFAPGARLLDLGCGPGASLELLTERGYAGVGLDRSPALLREARLHASCVQGDFSGLPFASSAFDGILCECALSLARFPSVVLSECLRVLRPGGRLLLSDLTLNGSSGPLPYAGRERLAPQQLAALLRQCGFSILHSQDHSRLLRELAARIIWHFGSLDAFEQAWRAEAPGTGGAFACPREKHLGYTLIIAEKAALPRPDSQ